MLGPSMHRALGRCTLLWILQYAQCENSTVDHAWHMIHFGVHVKAVHHEDNTKAGPRLRHTDFKLRKFLQHSFPRMSKDLLAGSSKLLRLVNNFHIPICIVLKNQRKVDAPLMILPQRTHISTQTANRHPSWYFRYSDLYVRSGWFWCSWTIWRSRLARSSGNWLGQQ